MNESDIQIRELLAKHANAKTKTKKKKIYSPFLWMGFNSLKARATSRRQFTFYH